jgi:hypothetical protein
MGVNEVPVAPRQFDKYVQLALPRPITLPGKLQALEAKARNCEYI